MDIHLQKRMKVKSQEPLWSVLARCHIQKKHHLDISEISEKLFKCVLKTSEKILGCIAFITQKNISKYFLRQSHYISLLFGSDISLS